MIRDAARDPLGLSLSRLASTVPLLHSVVFRKLHLVSNSGTVEECFCRVKRNYTCGSCMQSKLSTCFVAVSLLTVSWHSCESELDKLLVGDGHPRSLHLLIAASIAFSSTFYGRWLVNVCFVRSSRLLPGCETCDKYLRDGEQI